MDTTWIDDRFKLDSYKLAYFHFLLKIGGPLVVPEKNKGLVEEQVLVVSSLSNNEGGGPFLESARPFVDLFLLI